MGYVFGKTIQEARKNKGLTLEELGDEINLTKGYISGIETSNRRPPSDKIVCKMARVLGIKRKVLLRLAHIDKIPEDIKQELRDSTIITPTKIIHQRGHDLATALRESTPGRKKKSRLLCPVGYVPVLNSDQDGYPSDFTDIEQLGKSTDEFVQLNIPGLQISFALRMPDISMERKRGVSFVKGSLVFFSPAKRPAAGDNIFVVYRSEKGLSSIFRNLKEYSRKKVHLITLNSNYRKEIILPRQEIDQIWTAVAHLSLL